MADLDDRKALIQRLFGAANKHADEPRLEGYLEALKRMDTPRLVRLVDQVLDGIREMTDPNDYKPPTAGALWKLHRDKRRLPDPRPLELTPPPAAAMDGWDQNANLLLMQYLWAAHAPKNVTRYHVPGALQWLVKYKHAWAHDMRDDRAQRGKLDGKQHWTDCMALAEAEISKLVKRDQVAA